MSARRAGALARFSPASTPFTCRGALQECAAPPSACCPPPSSPFSRISHPKQRSRSIFISDSAIIARRDGILKFMFRVADIRRTQVCG